VGYDAAAGGANLSPANPKIAERARELLARPGMTDAGPVPAELVLASGSGLDAHVTLAAALYQAPRIAAARGVDPEAVAVLFAGLARDPGGGLARVGLVNVLAANLALDEAYGRLRAER
jgi:K+-transporting ATPase ATPase C chain